MSFELNFEDEGADLSKFWWMCCLMKVFEIQAHWCCQSKLTLKLVKFHQANLFLAVFSRLEPIWSGVRSPTQLPRQSRQALLVRVETCLLWLVFLPSPSFLTSSSPASKSSSRRSRWKFVQNSQMLVLEEYFCTTWVLKMRWKMKPLCVNQRNLRSNVNSFLFSEFSIYLQPLRPDRYCEKMKLKN